MLVYARLVRPGRRTFPWSISRYGTASRLYRTRIRAKDIVPIRCRLNIECGLKLCRCRVRLPFVARPTHDGFFRTVHMHYCMTAQCKRTGYPRLHKEALRFLGITLTSSLETSCTDEREGIKLRPPSCRAGSERILISRSYVLVLPSLSKQAFLWLEPGAITGSFNSKRPSRSMYVNLSA